MTFRWGWIGKETMACRKTPDLLYVPSSHSPRHDCQLRASSPARDQTCCRLLDFWESLLFIPAWRMTGHYCWLHRCGSAGNSFRWLVLIICVIVSDLIQEEMEGPAFVLCRNIVFLAKVGDYKMTADIKFINSNWEIPIWTPRTAKDKSHNEIMIQVLSRCVMVVCIPWQG